MLALSLACDGSCSGPVVKAVRMRYMDDDMDVMDVIWRRAMRAQHGAVGTPMDERKNEAATK